MQTTNTPDRYGCHNRPALPTLTELPATVPVSVDGYILSAEATRLVKNVFRRDCQYAQSALGRGQATQP